MSQINSGLRALLSNPIVYNTFQALMGANSVRKSFVDNYVSAEDYNHILDIGCGTADILAFFPESVKYTGFDSSESYIQFAQKKFGDRGLFHCGIVDSVRADSLEKVDVVLAIGLIHHLDDSEVETLLELAKSVLREGGRFIALDPCYEKGQNFFAKWLIDHDRGLNVRSQIEYKRLMSNSFSVCDSEVVHRSWIPYTHHIGVCFK